LLRQDSHSTKGYTSLKKELINPQLIQNQSGLKSVLLYFFCSKMGMANKLSLVPHESGFFKT